MAIVISLTLAQYTHIAECALVQSVHLVHFSKHYEFVPNHLYCTFESFCNPSQVSDLRILYSSVLNFLTL